LKFSLTVNNYVFDVIMTSHVNSAIFGPDASPEVLTTEIEN